MKKILLLVLLSFSLTLVSQESGRNLSNDFISKNTYFTKNYRNGFFLHTNKTTYFSGEKLWFKAYITDTYDNKLRQKNENLYLSVYNETKLITHHFFKAEKGTSTGEIKLPNDLPSGNYYVVIDTYLNQQFNFKGHATKIKIINTKNIGIDEIPTEFNHNDINSIDVSFYPENSYLLNNTYNTVLFTSKSNNQPVIVTGEIINTKTKKVVSTFQSNKFGLGKFGFMLEAKTNYIARIHKNSKSKEYKLPLKKTTGFTIHKTVVGEHSKTVDFNIKTTIETLANLKRKYLFLVLHKGNNLKFVETIKLSNNSKSTIVRYQKQNLFEGVNSISIFGANFKHIATRTFYEKKTKKVDLISSKAITRNDSIILNLSTQNLSKLADISVSVLPKKTKLYDVNSNSIFTSLLVSPFTVFNEKHKYSIINDNPYNTQLIDVAINTQKSNSVYNLTYPFIKNDYGVLLKGKVSSNVKNVSRYNIMLKSNNILSMSKINSNNTFEFENIALDENAEYSLALVNNKSKVSKASFYMYNDYLKYKIDSLIPEDYKYLTYQTILSNKIRNPVKSEKNTLLNEVTIASTKKKVVSDYILYPNLIGSTFSKKYEVNENDQHGGSVLDYLRNLPGIAVLNEHVSNIQFYSKRGQRTITGSNVMLIVFNGNTVTETEYLREIPATFIKRVDINQTGAGYGVRGQAGVIIIHARKVGKEFKAKKKSNSYIKNFTSKIGFSKPFRSFENDDLDFPSKKSEEHFSVLDWIPNFTLVPNKNNQLKIYNPLNLQEIKLIINGVSEDGQIIHKVINISTD
jgi:hypothetical protein